MAQLLHFMDAHFGPLWRLVIIGLAFRLAGVEVMAQRKGFK